MNIPDIVELLCKHSPKSLEDIKKLGIKCHEISKGYGAFRRVYKVRGLDLVFKIPRYTTDYETNISYNIEHARAEYSAVCRIERFKKYKILRQFMPQIFYFNWDCGIMAMEYYKPLLFTAVGEAGCNALSALVDSCWNKSLGTDICTNNVGLAVDVDRGDYNLKLIDLGCFLENK